MDNDPKSYRVPILRLKDLRKGNDASEEQSASATPTKKATVSEEDIQNAVITPTKTSEQPKVPTQPPVQRAPEDEFEEGPSLLLSERDIEEPIPTFNELPKKVTPIPDAPETIEVPEQTPPTPVTNNISQPAEPPVQQIPQPPAEVPSSQIPQPPEPVHIPVEEMEDGSDLQELIDKSLIPESELPEAVTEDVDAPPETPPAPTPEPRSFENEAVLPTADPLDIWELDAERRRHAPPPKPIVRTKPIQKPVSEPVPPVPPVQEAKPSSPKAQGVSEQIPTTQPSVVETSPLPETPPLTAPSSEEGEGDPASEGSDLLALRARIAKENMGGNASAHVSNTQAPKQTPPRPHTEHASAIANVADALKNIQQEGVPARSQIPPQDPVAHSENVPEVSSVSRADSDTSVMETSKSQPRQEVPRDNLKTENAPTSALPLVRTFKADVEQTVMKNRTSIVDMVSAEEKRRGLGETVRMAPRMETSPVSYLLMGASLALIIAGILIGVYLLFRFFTTEKYADTSDLLPTNALVEYDATDMTGQDLRVGLTELSTAIQTAVGNVTEIRVIERTNYDSGAEKITVTPARFFEKLETNAPGALIRSAGDRMVLGVHTMKKNEPFWVFRINHYENGFRSMLEWERSVKKDLAPLFGALPTESSKSVSPFSTTGTTSPIDSLPQYAPNIEEYTFEDITVANREARGLRNTQGDIVLLWAIPDAKTVIITTNIATMETIISRMFARSYQ